MNTDTIIGGAKAPTLIYLKSDHPFLVPTILIALAALFFGVRYWNRKRKK